MFRRNATLDFLFFISVFAVPTNFFNFLPSTLFVDTKLLYLVVGLFYIVFNIKNYLRFIKIPGAKFLVLLIVFLCFRISFSYTINDISFIEIITIFRTNYSYPIITFGFLLYAVGMDNKRLFRFVFWIFIVSMVTSVIYVFSNLTGLNSYANIYKDYQTFDDTLIIQNLAAISKYNIFLFTSGIFALLTQSNFKRAYYIYIPLIVVILSNVRNQLLVYVILLICCILFVKISRFNLRVTKYIRFFFIGVFSLIVVATFFQAHISRFIDKFGVEEIELLDSTQYLEEGTFKVRLELIEDAQQEISDNLLLGNGYKREARKGQYDYAVGTDTLVAPVLYTEGYIGFFMRLLPILFFLSFSIKNIRSKDKMITYSSIIMLSIIVANAVNIVQTRIFTYYHEVIFIFFLFMFISYNNANNRDLDVKQLS